MNQKLFIACLLLILFVRYLTLPRTVYPPGTRVGVTATLKEEPKVIGSVQRFNVLGLKITAGRYPEYHYGDQLEILGTIKNGNEIEMAEEIRVVGKTNDIRGWMMGVRRKIEDIYRYSLPEPQASLLSGIVLGSKAGMPKEFYQDLIKTGTVHMVVASGMNVVIVGETLVSIFLLVLSRRKAIIFGFLGIWLYVLLAGGEIPVVRAGIMGSLVLLAGMLGREADAWRGLALSAVILLLINPLDAFDIGFQLSFAATGGILLIGPRISKLIYKAPTVIKTNIAQTLGAQIATLPIILVNFGQYSLLSPLTNLLLVEILPLIMYLGLLVGLAGMIFPGLARLLAWLAYPLLTYFVEIVRLFGNL